MHGIVYCNAARFYGRAVDAEAALTLASNVAQDLGVAFRRHGINGDNRAATVAFVDTHAHATDAQVATHPAVLGEWRLSGRLHQYIRPKSQDVERSANYPAEPVNGLRGDDGQRESVKDAAVLLDDLDFVRAEFCCERRVRDIEDGPLWRSHDRR